LWFAEGGSEARALVYFATPDNPNFLGPAPLSEMAEQVLGAEGPSGANAEYVLRLAEAVAALGEDDEHVRSVAELVSAGQRARQPRSASG
jgi:glutathione-specific gamma-glutamylcyclotransferase